MTNFAQQVDQLEREWAESPRWHGVERTYTAADVVSLRGSLNESHTLSGAMSERLWELMASSDYVNALGALSGGQAVQMVKAGLQAIYLSGWQVAGDANLAGRSIPISRCTRPTRHPRLSSASTTRSVVRTRSPGRRAITTPAHMPP